LGNLFDDFFGKDFIGMQPIEGKHTIPSINVKETENEYFIEVAAPGLKRENFGIEVENNVLTVSYDQKEENEVKDKGIIRHEFHYSSFRRSFSVPKNEIDDSKIEACYKDGILKISLQKRAEVKPKPARVIEIK
jgi:HSP20 family protein